MAKEQIIVPFDKGNVMVILGEDDLMKIIVTSNGIKYEFEATPVGIESYKVDGGVKKNYTMISEKV